MAIGLKTILKQVAKLKKTKKVFENNIKVLEKRKQPVSKMKDKLRLIDKSIDKLENQKKQLPSSKKVSTAKPKVKRNIVDRSKVIGLSAEDAQMVRFGGYAGVDKEMIRLREAIKKVEAKPNLSAKAKEDLKLQKEKYKRMVAKYGKPSDEKKTGGPIVKKPMGGKVYKNTVARKHGGAIGTGAALRGFGKGYKKG